MARETKVGLLAGLAFIICFAIILANGGRQKAQTTPWHQLVDQRAKLGHTTPDPGSAVNPNRRPGTPTHRSVGQQFAAADVRSASVPVRVDDLESSGSTPGLPESGAEVVLPTRPLRSSSSADAEMPPGNDGGGATRTTAGPAQTGPAAVPTHTRRHPTPIHAGSTATLDPDARRRDLEDLLEARTSRAGQDGEEAGSMRRNSTNPIRRSATTSRLRSSPAEDAPRSMPQRRTQAAHQYTVQPGDTLSRIAFTHYGSRSAKVVDAIFRANSSTLSSPDLITVGVELVLPAVDGLSGPQGAPRQDAVPVPPARQRANPITQGETDFRWYQVKRDDRYVSIAREQLGDAKRWREIFDLNKDKFPNPDRIRHGVRIKLPAGEVVSTGAGR